MAIQGLRTSGNFATDERPKHWREGLLMRYPNGQFPLTGLTSKMKSRSVDDAEFNWWEKEVQTRRLEVTADRSTTDTQLPVTAGAMGFKEGDLFYVNQTAEILRVMTDPTSDTSLTVKRGFSGTTAAAIDYDGAGKDPYVTCIGSAYEEGSSAPTGVNFDPAKVNNYTQIFRNTLEATRTALKTRLRTTDQAREAKRECLEYHGIDMERAFFFGVKNESVLKGKPIRTTAGVLSFVPAGNIITADTSTGTDFETLEGYMEQIFRFGSSEKLVFTGNIALLTLQRIIRGAKGINWSLQSDKEFGMNVTRVSCPFGTLVFKTHPLFNQMVGGTTGGTAYYGLNSHCIILDMENVKYVNLKDSDTKYESNLQDNGVDGMKSGYLTECGLEVAHAKTHWWIKNLAMAKDEA